MHCIWFLCIYIITFKWQYGLCGQPGRHQPGKNADGAVLAELAGVLLDVVPHAASAERVFSQMGWFEGTTSHRMATSTTAKKVAIKLHYDAMKPAKRK
jgi:hypothetical protein